MSNRLNIIIWGLLLYVLAQFTWWAYQIYDLSGGNLWMVLGEGGVFVVILLLGFWFIRKSILREVEMAERQRNFLLAITHELKTPIASIRLYLETILKRNPDQAKRTQMLEKTIEENVRIDGLINDVLTAARMESNRHQLQPEKINIKSVTHDVIGQLSDKVLIEVPELTIIIDVKAFEMIISNLVENALKYGQYPITVSAVQQDDRVEIAITDAGQGLSDSEKKKVTDKFYRVGNESTRKSKGTGLGLYLVKELVNASGGKLSIKDNWPKGCIFVVDFPNG